MIKPNRPSRKTGGFTLVEVLVSLTMLSIASLAPGTTCITVSDPLPGTRCTTINNVTSRVKEVTVVVTPSGNPLLKPITTTFTRTTSGNGTPLKTP